MVRASDDRQKFMTIAVQQRDVPLHRLAETLVVVFPDREVAAIENRKIDIRLRADQAQQRRLILDRMAHQVGEPPFFSHNVVPGWRSASTIRRTTSCILCRACQASFARALAGLPRPAARSVGRNKPGASTTRSRQLSPAAENALS